MEEERDSTSIIESKTAPGRDSRQFDWFLSASRQAGTSTDSLKVVLFLIGQFLYSSGGETSVEEEVAWRKRETVLQL